MALNPCAGSFGHDKNMCASLVVYNIKTAANQWDQCNDVVHSYKIHIFAIYCSMCIICTTFMQAVQVPIDEIFFFLLILPKQWHLTLRR
jgi:hypothetical protein